MSSEPYPPDDAAESPPATEEATLGSSTIYQLCVELIALREMNNRQHKLFDQTVTKTRDTLTGGFDRFAADTQRAFQQLRQEVHGEKRVSLNLLNELLDLGMELEHIVGSKPDPADAGRVARWMESLEVQARRVQDALRKHGIHPYDAVVSSPYNPALHERVGSARVEGMGPNLIAEQRERGYASQQPEFVLRRPKVVVTE